MSDTRPPQDAPLTEVKAMALHVIQVQIGMHVITLDAASANKLRDELGAQLQLINIATS